MIIQDKQFALYVQKQPNMNVKQSEQTVKTDAETEKQDQDFRSRFDEKAASLSISEKREDRIFEIRRAAGDLKVSSTDTQIKDTALNQMQGLLRRTNALTVQALNDTDGSNIETRIKNLKDEIERISRMEKTRTEEDVQAAEERIVSKPEQAMSAQANQDTERALGLLM